MSGAHETPRQKMIGMMYLVLTALLALNVSKDILDAFIVVNNGLENTNKDFTKRNDELYTEFNLAKTIDPVRVSPNWEKAQNVKKQSVVLTGYIEDLKKRLVAETDGVPKNVADTMKMVNIASKDNYDVPTNVLIGDSEDGAKGASRELKNKLIAFKKLLSGYILPADRKKVEININTDDPAKNENNENWETYNFFHRPLVASITILSKLSNDVKNAESTTVDYLLKQVDEGNLKFDTVAAKVIPQSNYVLLGEEYKADLFLAAFNKTKNPEIEVGASKIPVERGLGKYNVRTSREGIMNYSGTVKVVAPSGKEIVFPFKSEYIVARPALTVSADKMNVIYAGLDNPFSVSVPGIPNERLSVSINNGTITPLGNGKFNVKATNPGTKAMVSVAATMENGEKRSMGTSEFRVKGLPTPLAKYAGMTTDGNITKGAVEVNTALSCYYDKFDFEAKPVVTEFMLTIISKGMVVYDGKVTGNTIPENIRKTILPILKRGDRISFSSIKAVGPDNKPVPLLGINFKVI